MDEHIRTISIKNKIKIVDCIIDCYFIDAQRIEVIMTIISFNEISIYRVSV